MDWFNNKDDEIYVDNSSNSLSYDLTFNIENVFNKQNSCVDYEVKIEDFIPQNTDTNMNSKLPSPDYKIFEVYNKNLSQEANTVSNTPNMSEKRTAHPGKSKEKQNLLRKEDLARHPFLVSHAPDIIKSKTRHSKNKSNTRPEKLSISQINQISTASIEENSESLNKSFESDSKQNLKFNVKQNNAGDINKPSYDLTSINNYYMNEEEKRSVTEDCHSLVNNDSYSIFENNNNNYNLIDCKFFDSRKEMNIMHNNNIEYMRNKISKQNNINCAYQENNFINSNSTIPCNFSLRHLPLSERMKIKREKTKMLLEKKTKRENFSFNLNSDNTALCVQDPNTIELMPAEENISISNKNENNLNEELSNSCSYLSPVNFANNKLSKKDIKILRNRISAQRSRDRKKREMDDLKVISQNLFNENCYLQKELENKDKELFHLKNKLKLFCKNCDSAIKANDLIKENTSSCSSDLPSQNFNNCRPKYSLVDLSRRNLSNSSKYSLMTGFLVVVCLIGTLAWQSISSNIDSNNLTSSSFSTSTGRVLLSNDVENIPIVDKKNENSLTGVILYQNPGEKENYLNQASGVESEINLLKKERMELPDNNSNTDLSIKTHKKIFNISKDFDKYKQINKKSSFSSNSYGKENNSFTRDNKIVEEEEIDDYSNLDVNIPFNFETSLLEKKRFEFFIKMQNRKSKTPNAAYIPSGGFLRKEIVQEENVCVNTDDLTWSMQEEIELNDENDKLFKANFPKDKFSTHKGIILKTNDYNNYNINPNLMNQVVPLKDKRFNNESSLLKQNIKSMFCRDFKTTAEENSEMFKKLFEKLRMKQDRENVTFNSSTGYYDYDKNSQTNSLDDECMYLHMIVPALDQERRLVDQVDESSRSFSDEEERFNHNEKKVFYEVGCKIFEINKIYK